MSDFKVLIVEDEPTTSFLLRGILNKLRVAAIVAGSAEEGLRRLDHEGGYNCIFVDWNLPQMNGLEFVQRIKTSRRLDNPYLIMMTHEDCPQLLEPAFAAGVSDFLAKPLDLANVWARIRTAQRVLEAERANVLQEFEYLKDQGRLMALHMVNQLIHELANPLANVSFLAGMAAENPNVPQRIMANIERVSGILRTERQKFLGDEPPREEPIELTALVAEAAAVIGPKARELGVELRIQSEVTDAVIHGNPHEVFQVLMNLLANGCEAVAQQDERWVEVELKASPMGIQIAVTDSGTSLQLAAGEKLLRAPATSKPGHMGFGLKLVRLIVEAHGGVFRYEPAGAHTRFVTEWPKRAEPTPVRRAQ